MANLIKKNNVYKITEKIRIFTLLTTIFLLGIITFILIEIMFYKALFLIPNMSRDFARLIITLTAYIVFFIGVPVLLGIIGEIICFIIKKITGKDYTTI
jgi:hypothetical protein